MSRGSDHPLPELHAFMKEDFMKEERMEKKERSAWRSAWRTENVRT